MSATFALLLLYCSGAIESISSDVFIASFTVCLLCSFTLISNIIIYLRPWGLKMPGYLWMSRSRPLQYLFG